MHILPDIASVGRPLRGEAEIIRHWGERSTPPLVSICCATHNHRPWIEDALRGFLAQETTFPFEIIVRDDASVDGTTEVVRDFSRRYPHIVRPLINAENRFGQGERAMHVWPSVARGKFIALCEGDDYWTSCSKLQKQVELLDQHPEAVMSVALTCQQHAQSSERRMFSTVRRDDKTLLDPEDVHTSYYHTSTYVIRSDVLFPVVRHYFEGHALFGDTALRAILVSLGPFALLPEVVSVYRVTGQGIWTSLDPMAKLQWEFDAARKLARMLSGKHSRRQANRLYRISLDIARAHARRGDVLAGLRWAPRVIWYGVRKIPAYVSRKLKESSTRTRDDLQART